MSRYVLKFMRSPYLLLIPVFALLVSLLVVPVVWALFLSFTQYVPGDKPLYIGLRNYIEIAQDPLFLQALINNIIFVSVVVFLEFLIGIGAALVLDHGFPLQKFRTKGKDLIYWFLLAIALSWAILPVFYITISSFKLPKHIWDYPPTFAGPFSLDNYRTLVLTHPEFFAHLKNSLIITTGAVLITLFSSFSAGFVFSRFKNKWLKLPAFFLIASRMFPPIIITIPLFPLLYSLELIDKHVTLMVILSCFMVSLATLMIKVFIDSVPVELEEQAMIDGCTRWKAFIKITLPLTRPGIVAVMIFVAIPIWNEYNLHSFSLQQRRRQHQ